MGSAGPVTLAGALVQPNAEVLAGLVLAQLAYYSLARHLSLVASASLWACATRKYPRVASRRLSSTRRLCRLLTAMACADFAGQHLRSKARCASAGGDCSGLLHRDSSRRQPYHYSSTGPLMVSYEHLVDMDELINQRRSITGGITTDVDSLALDSIAQCSGPEGNFFDSERTKQFMKRDVYYSEFCGRIETSYEDFYEKHIAVSVTSRLEGIRPCT